MLLAVSKVRTKAGSRAGSRATLSVANSVDLLEVMMAASSVVLMVDSLVDWWAG